MDSENDRKEEEGKIFSRRFCLLSGFTDVDSENDRMKRRERFSHIVLSLSRVHRHGFRKRQYEEEGKILPRRFCLLAGFIHAAPERDRKKERRREIRTHLDLAVGVSSRGRKIA